MSHLTWGWRIACSHPGCTRTIEQWDARNLPPLPGQGYLQSGPATGWYMGIHRNTRSDFEHSAAGHRAFCPLHSESVVKWVAEKIAWGNKRDTAARLKVAAEMLCPSEFTKTWRTRLADCINPVKPSVVKKQSNYEIWQRAVNMDMRDWVKANPSPRPPWETP